MMDPCFRRGYMNSKYNTEGLILMKVDLKSTFSGHEKLLTASSTES